MNCQIVSASHSGHRICDSLTTNVTKVIQNADNKQLTAHLPLFYSNYIGDSDEQLDI